MTQPWYERHPVLAALIFFVVVLLIFGGGSLNGPDPNARRTQVERPFPEEASGPHGLDR